MPYMETTEKRTSTNSAKQQMSTCISDTQLNVDSNHANSNVLCYRECWWFNFTDM